jgi:Ca-activated chloride channel homolog
MRDKRLEPRMLEWAWPWMFALIPLPLLLGWLRHPAETSPGAALRLPYAALGVELAHGAAPVPIWRRLIAALAWLLLVTAAARPQWVGEAIELPRSGRDLLLAVDSSGSMSTEDMEIGGRGLSRFSAVQMIASDFINRREGDRVGLVLFGSQAYLLTPLTFDRKTVLTQLNEAAVGLAGRETAIGDAIGLAVKRLRARPTGQRVLILLTDGVNTAGELNPRKATELAVSEHVRLYTIGIGADAMRVDGLFGSRMVNPSADLDAGLLTELAEKTGGRFFRARNTAELAQIYREIDTLEPADDNRERFRPVDPLFQWPLGTALVLVMLAALQPLLKRRRLSGAFAQ